MCVCRTDEGGRRKCGQYWPQEEGGQEVYGHIAVVNHRVDNHAHYNQTTLELHNTEVTHIHRVYISVLNAKSRSMDNQSVIMISYMIHIMMIIVSQTTFHNIVYIVELGNITTKKMYCNI